MVSYGAGERVVISLARPVEGGEEFGIPSKPISHLKLTAPPSGGPGTLLGGQNHGTLVIMARWRRECGGQMEWRNQ